MSRRFCGPVYFILDTFNFRAFFPAKIETPPCLRAHSRGSIRYQKGKLNVIKRQKISFLGLQVLLPGLWNLKDIQISHQNRSKNKLVREIIVTRAYGSCSLRAKGSRRNPEPAIRNARRGIQNPRLSLITLYGATYFLSIQPADLECFRDVSTIYHSLFG